MSNQRYTEEFKAEAVKQITERGHKVGWRRHSAINKALGTSSVSMRRPIDQPTTWRENKSITTLRYSQPSWVRM